MGMESIVELIQHRITPMDSEWDKVNIDRTFHRDDYKSLNVVIDLLKRGEENKKLLREITFIAGFNITIESEREEVETILQEYVKNMKVKKILIRTDRRRT